MSQKPVSPWPWYLGRHFERARKRMPRSGLATCCLALLCGLLCSAGTTVHANDRLTATARIIEAQLGAELGMAVYDSGNATWSLYKPDQRFPMASTFKVLACAALLDSDAPDAATMRVERLQEYSPVTKDLLGQAVSPYQMCEATMRTSDNTAANLVLEAIGGPGAVTHFVRALGDSVTQLDRWEPELNEGTPGDIRDTTTPRAMAETVRKLILGDAIAAPARDLLKDWLVANAVGGPLLRAGVPDDWTIGDRTGAGGHGTRGVVAVMWPPGRAPLVAAIYITGTEASLDMRNAAIAELGRIIAELETTP